MQPDRRQLALDAIAPHRAAGLGHFIAGEAVDGQGGAHDIFEPASGAVLGQFRDATPDETDRAVQAAVGAFGEWSAMPGERRRSVLNKVADLIEARADDIAAVECLDAGQPWRYMAKAAVRGAENFRFFADRAPAAFAARAAASSPRAR